jgi:nucleoside-diphosphate-sugar epimerase
MVYVDNVAESLLAALFADEDRVSGEAFNIGSGDKLTWREFYAFFARGLGLDLAKTPRSGPGASRNESALASMLSFPGNLVRGVGDVVSSKEFKSLGRRVLWTDPIGTMPRKALERLPWLERGVRRLIKADGSLPIYEPEMPAHGEVVQMGSAGGVLSIEKLRERLGFVPPVQQEGGLQLTLEWVRHANLV